MKMKASAPLILLAAAVFHRRETAAQNENENLRGCVEGDPTRFGPDHDFFPSKISPLHSELWDVEYFSTYKILTNRAANETYLLYQCGTTPPQDEIDGGDHAAVAEIPPPDGVALTSTVQIPMMELLGLRTAIRTYLGDDQYISSPCLRSLIDSGEVEAYNPSDASSLESWSDLHPDRIVLHNDSPYSPGRDTPNGIVESGHLEGPNKAVFEWLYVYAVLFNLESTATEIFDDTATTYDCITNNAHVLATEESRASLPVAAWAYYSTYEGSEGWVVASCDPKDNYYCEYARHCDTTLLSRDADDAVLDHEEFAEFAGGADMLFYLSSDWNTVYADNTEMMDGFKAVQNGQVFDYQGSGGGAWFEQRMAEYDVVLQDFCTAVNMTTNAFPHQRRWFRNVFTEPVGDLPACGEDPGAPLETRSTPCIALAASTSTTNNDNGKDGGGGGGGGGGGAASANSSPAAIAANPFSTNAWWKAFPSSSIVAALLFAMLGGSALLY